MQPASHRRRLALLLVATSVFTTAGTAADPEVSDPCGDAGDILHVNDQTVVGAPDEGRAAGFDGEAVWFEGLEDGSVRITLDLCGSVPGVDLHGSLWEVSWQLTEECGARVNVNDIRDQSTLEVERQSAFVGSCSRPSDFPPGDWYESYEVFREPLSGAAVSIEDDRVTWTLDPSGSAAESAAVLAPGTEWARPRLRTLDGRRATGGSQEGGGPVSFRFGGPGAMDESGYADGRTFVVGAEPRG